MDLPTAWNPDDKSTYLSVDSNGLKVNYIGLGRSQIETGAIRANNPIPPQCKLFYFEVDIIDEGKNKIISIGFCEKTVNLNRMPGWDNGSWGYHGDNGYFFFSGDHHHHGPLFSTGDTIGCCLNFKNNTVFYTRNGINLGIAFQNLKGTLYPCVGLRSQSGSIEVNFGSRKFKYAEVNSDDVDEKEKWIDAFHTCINVTNTYTPEDLEKEMKIEKVTALKFRGKFNFIMGNYEDAITNLTKLLDIESNNKFALRYRGEAYYLMGKYNESIKDVNKLLEIEANDKWASNFFTKISEKEYELGYFYLHGINVEKDEYKAFTHFEKSANMGHTEGMNCLGYCYEYGIGVEKDEKDEKNKKDENKAFTLYQKSANMNNSNGMYQVGYCYYLGIGVEIDRHKAFAYYLKSAEAGNSMGIFKTAISYKFGIGIEEKDDEKKDDKFREWIEKDPFCRFFRLDLDISIGRSPKYGKCAHCKEDNTNPAWCLSCDPDIATRWTSGNKDIDDCMKTFQLRSFTYEDAIEWIPFDKLSDLRKIGKGGFGSVYEAKWSEGIRKVEKINNGDIYKRARKQCSVVALKALAGSKEDFLKEFRGLMECKLNYSSLAIYGITQNSQTNEYLMVFQYANNGSLYKYLSENFSKLTWRDKLQILKDVSLELHRIHSYAGRIHADFHSGNILIDKQDCIRSYISDLGLSRKLNEKISEGNIYGVIPYVAPEVLSGSQQFTQAADIYGFGVVMAEMSTGQRPFDSYKFDTNLVFKIWKGLRPGFGIETPKCYIELAKKCMNSDPQKRPSTHEIYWRIYDWLYELDSNYESEIKEQFLEADKVNKTLPTTKHPNEMYTSKNINFK